jgi:ubiquinone/menaquinone biosynthesis C-methylase UbiE
VEARSDNSPEKNSKNSLLRTGEGIVIDIGTGDGRFVSAAARANPNKFFIGIDANVKPLEKPSLKATRKRSKGGLLNAMFVQAAVEDLPHELDGVADEIHIHFPWGSLLKAVASGDRKVIGSLRRIATNGCLLEIVIGLDPHKDETEIARLELAALSDALLKAKIIPQYRSAGFEIIEHRRLEYNEWRQIESSWARRLQDSTGRIVTYLVFQAT